MSIIAVTSSVVSSVCFSSPALAEFSEIHNSSGVKSLNLRFGDAEVPIEGDQIEIHYYGRLAAKQGWRFDSTYDHKDSSGEAVTFILGSNKVIAGIETAVRSMKVGGIRRVIIPPSQGYQNTSQEPLPPNEHGNANFCRIWIHIAGASDEEVLAKFTDVVKEFDSMTPLDERTHHLHTSYNRIGLRN